mmetsp:Transcript_50542/g.116654  ORF Transcript_50542/g.116654 Transcript_50542/m.116654 type:complete len:291 (-) Transcript_50542:186-1058(-)|eukprot:CAMPEP_0119373856 /NCGR_PEP_ID=MMETSP1334-20130426/27877_1 /TAXON_ID=127549 /ORGANISM="Calcidiscus leptoporus, Strain RCC1130" /LENGTH=290 /DNA_ID=CAMNT_0007391741 /DNA_START=86 /DNA_END=958 /DNA_ORIENTATION=+
MKLFRSLRRAAPAAGLLIGGLSTTTAGACLSSPRAGPASLADSTVVIFGGSSGIGKAVALGVASQGASHVHIIGRDETKLKLAKVEIEAAASRKCAVQIKALDVTNEPAVRSYLGGFEDGSIDHLVTTPGGSARLGNLIANERSCDDVRRQLDLKFFAQLAPVLAVGEKIKPGGSITMTSGVLSRRTGRGNDALAIANAAIECAVKCFANDYGYDGRMVRVNCLSPGMTLTPVYGDSDAMKAYQAKCAAKVPLQRNSLAEEQAHAILFLMTNTFVTGLVLDCDGGHIVMP